MRLNAPPMRRWVREMVVPRAPALTIAILLVMLGLYPGPMLVLLSNPAWRTEPIVRLLASERAFWTAGFFVIVGPAIVLANMVPERFDRVWTFVRTRLGAVRDRWFLIGAGTFAAVVAAIAASYVLSNKPTTSDEVAQLWHARILLSGRLWLPPDPNPEFFAVDNIIDRGRWYSQFPTVSPASSGFSNHVACSAIASASAAGPPIGN